MNPTMVVVGCIVFRCFEFCGRNILLIWSRSSVYPSPLMRGLTGTLMTSPDSSVTLLSSQDLSKTFSGLRSVWMSLMECRNSTACTLDAGHKRKNTKKNRKEKRRYVMLCMHDQRRIQHTPRVIVCTRYVEEKINSYQNSRFVAEVLWHTCTIVAATTQRDGWRSRSSSLRPAFP